MLEGTSINKASSSSNIITAATVKGPAAIHHCFLQILLLQWPGGKGSTLFSLATSIQSHEKMYIQSSPRIKDTHLKSSRYIFLVKPQKLSTMQYFDVSDTFSYKMECFSLKEQILTNKDLNLISPPFSFSSPLWFLCTTQYNSKM